MIYPANRADARFVGNEISLKRKREARGLPFCRYHDGLDCMSQPNGCLPSLPYDKLAHTLSFIQACFKVVSQPCGCLPSLPTGKLAITMLYSSVLRDSQG